MNELLKISSIAKKTNPFYKEWIKDNLFCKPIPREIFFKNNKEILNNNTPNAFTSGSSGTPIQIYRSEELGNLNSLVDIEYVSQFPGLKQVGITFHSLDKNIDINFPTSKKFQELKKRDINGISTMPSVMEEISLYLLSNNKKLNKIKYITLMGENVEDYQLDIIKKAFPQAFLSSTYSTVEVGPIGYSCPHDIHSYHLYDDKLFIEVLNENDKACSLNELGEITITDYYNIDTPVIRYKLGDLGKFSICSCGKKCLTDIRGKTRGFIYKLDRTRETFLDYSVMLRDIDGMMQYQVLQNDLEELEIKVKSIKDIKEEIKQKTIQYFGRLPNTFSITEVEAIEKTKSGKFIACINKVKLNE